MNEGLIKVRKGIGKERKIGKRNAAKKTRKQQQMLPD